MRTAHGKAYGLVHIALLTLASLLTAAFCTTLVHAQNSEVLGEIQFEGKSKVEKTSGVWVDGQYVGYLDELKGSKKVLLLPGEHTISVRQNGYQDFNQEISLQPDQVQIIRVTMNKAATGPMPAELATVKLEVHPSRAAVFVDDRFVGHVGELGGLGHSMQVVPGVHQVKIALPGYETFATEINPLAKQKVEIKTELVKSQVPVAEPLLKGAAGEMPAASEARDAGGPQR